MSAFNKTLLKAKVQPISLRGETVVYYSEICFYYGITAQKKCVFSKCLI